MPAERRHSALLAHPRSGPMSSAKARGRKIAVETRDLARRQAVERESYWTALLARPQLAGPIVHAIQQLDAADWHNRLAALRRYGREASSRPRVRERGRYLRGAARAAAWLARKDRRATVADECAKAIGLWAARQLPGEHRWSERLPQRRGPNGRFRSPAQAGSYGAPWLRYWAKVEASKRERERLRNRIVEINEGLVISAINKWPWAVGHLGINDLHQVAREGLMVAAALYEHERPEAFSTYAMWWIRHKTWREHQNGRTDVRVAIGVQLLAQQLAPLVADHPAWPPEQIRERWGLELDARHEMATREAEAKSKRAPKRPKTPTHDAVKRAMAYMGHRELSLEQPVGEHDGLTLGEVLPDQSLPIDEQLHQGRVFQRLTEALEQLPADQREIIEARYGLEGPERSVRDLTRAGLGTGMDIETTEEQALECLRYQLAG